MEIYSIHFTLDLIETDVVEALETGTVDRPNPVVRDKEMFFPSHKNMLALSNVLDGNGGTFPRLFRERSESRELRPVREVDLVTGAPGVVFRNEAVLCSNDLSFEVCSQCRVVFCKACER